MQERQFPPFDFETLTLAEKKALRASARRTRSLVASVGAGMLALFVIGCPQPGDLENPNAYPAPAPAGGSAATAGSSTGGAATVSCETACVNQLFQKDQQPCLFCHSKATKLGDLDLESADYTARLKNVPAKHTGIVGSTATCPTGDKLIDTDAPANSWFLKKILDTHNGCGTLMPQVGALTADQKTCLQTYVACVAPGGGATPTAGTGSGGTATATAGTASGGSGGTGGTGGT